jgi:hypothetical protein
LIDLAQLGVANVQNAASNAPSPHQNRYRLVAMLAARNLPTTLTVADRLDLSAYLIRVHKPRDAVNVLAPAQFQERDNFLVLSNLATAEQLDGQSRRARDYLADALRIWPKDWSALSEPRRKTLMLMGWNEGDFAWYREVEAYQFKLLRLRAKEPAEAANRLPETVDAIFDSEDRSQGALRFVGPSGRYEAGKLAPAERAKLPPKALEIVQQLLIWQPFDTRLYWLCGELFNAEGDVPAARAMLQNAASKWQSVDASGQTAFKSDAALPRELKEHLDVLRADPRSEVTVADPAVTLAPATEPVAYPENRSVPPVEWRSMAVGFGVGIVVAFLGSWQIRELRRRRASRGPLRSIANRNSP